MHGGSGLKSKPVRLIDIAQKAGVSITTVSHVINKTRYVKRETREYILKIMEELSYEKKKPKSVHSTTRFIGVIVANILEDYYISVIKAIETYASEQGFSILLCDSENDAELEKLNIRSILEKNVGGIILAPVDSRKCPKEILTTTIPMVFVDRKYEGADKIFVGINNFESGYAGTHYLATKGCKNIGFISYPETVYTCQQRLLGYSFYIQKNFANAAPNVLTLNYKQEDSNRLICKFIEDAKPDGVLCATSDICYQLIGSLEEMGISIPQQIKIVTYDDNKWLDYLKYPISVITQPTVEIGFMAIDNLIRLMQNEGEDKKIGTSIFLETGFIDRL